jgi:hypothetical protein
MEKFKYGRRDAKAWNFDNWEPRNEFLWRSEEESNSMKQASWDDHYTLWDKTFEIIGILCIYTQVATHELSQLQFVRATKFSILCHLLKYNQVNNFYPNFCLDNLEFKEEALV